VIWAKFPSRFNRAPDEIGQGSRPVFHSEFECSGRSEPLSGDLGYAYPTPFSRSRATRHSPVFRRGAAHLDRVFQCAATGIERMRQTTRLRRSLLFVPGSEQRKLDRSRETAADLLIFDLEDSVAPDHKARAREMVADHIRSVGSAEPEFSVRVNPLESPDFEADLEAVVSAGARTIMLPKSQSPEDLENASATAARLEAKFEAPGESVRLLALVETAAGISRVEALADADSRIDALCFGNADFSLDMGLPEADTSTGVLLHARCRLAIAAAAAKVTPIDGVCLAVKDTAAFLEEGNLALRLGFEGKLCIHPAQVEIANSIFTPTAGQIETALRVIEGWEAAVADGKGVFALDGKMIDPPLVDIQQRVIDRAKQAGVFGKA